jgi:hypothetical protein
LSNSENIGNKGSPFKNSSHRYYLKGLFYETTLADKSSVVYTLKDHDHQGYPSLYRLYMAEKDPTEYRFANNHLGSWSHWTELCGCSWFDPYVSRWRHELELYIKSEALVKLFEEAENTLGKNSFNANKYLLEKGWVEKEKATKGRPSKQDIKNEATRMAKELEQIDGDFERLVN